MWREVCEECDEEEGRVERREKRERPVCHEGVLVSTSEADHALDAKRELT